MTEDRKEESLLGPNLQLASLELANCKREREREREREEREAMHIKYDL